MKTVIQVPAYKEVRLTETLDEIAAQETAGYPVSYEAWVTPSGPKESCGTWKQAVNHPVFEAFEAPQGKLSTRNDAHESAVSRGYEATITWDADAPPLSNDVLLNLCNALATHGVSAVMATPESPDTTLGNIVDRVSRYMQKFRPYIHGQCSGFTAEAWVEVGPFNTNIDQTHVKKVWNEEELAFYNRLSRVGEVRKLRDAKVRNDTRRWACRFKDPFKRSSATDQYCRDRGVETFEPNRYNNRNRRRRR